MLTGTAVILAGGNSIRMGFDKQCIRLNDELLIAHQIQVLQNIFEEIIIVTNKPKLYKGYNCRLATDQLRDYGPLGGIHAGLLSARSQFSYFIACDMPNINEDYISYLLQKIHGSAGNTQAVITRFGNWLEPFNAFYSKSMIPVIEQAYMDNNRKITRVLKKAEASYIEEAIARAFSPDWSMFTNINTPKDLIKLKAL